MTAVSAVISAIGGIKIFGGTMDNRCYANLDARQKELELAALRREYDGLAAKKLKIDMTRGKPCKEQFDLSNQMLAMFSDGGFVEDGVDVRNYGLAEGTSAMRRIFSQMSGIPADNIIIGGNSSISLIFDAFVRAYTIGLAHSEKPWSKYGKVKLICPVPGYDRHFSICEYFGAEMLPVKILDDGPDMDEVERLARDPDVRGMICVPTYSNPSGVTFSDAVCRRIASLNAAAPDFTVFWDNAYAVHDLNDAHERSLEIIGECERAGNPERPIVFMSTSKITFSGSGVACVAGSAGTLANIRKMMSRQIIGYDKINQVMHSRFLRDIGNITAHMRKHADIIRPKFDAVLETLERELAQSDVARWSIPNGGYFISFYAADGTASRIVEMCGDAGVAFTPAGAAFPYGKDPDDAHIRIAPTLPSVEELKTATHLLCVCAKITALEKLCY